MTAFHIGEHVGARQRAQLAVGSVNPGVIGAAELCRVALRFLHDHGAAMGAGIVKAANLAVVASHQKKLGLERQDFAMEEVARWEVRWGGNESVSTCESRW